ncbi:uncharacterized protein LOC135281355 [Passer domesticus]|uniref:uncharacterized protein LOC135281355 n=1 Tax=Passer domesticus TaxID=48849 RepID=UPI0030FEF189
MQCGTTGSSGGDADRHQSLEEGQIMRSKNNVPVSPLRWLEEGALGRPALYTVLLLPVTKERGCRNKFVPSSEESAIGFPILLVQVRQLKSPCGCSSSSSTEQCRICCSVLGHARLPGPGQGPGPLVGQQGGVFGPEPLLAQRTGLFTDFLCWRGDRVRTSVVGRCCLKGGKCEHEKGD